MRRTALLSGSLLILCAFPSFPSLALLSFLAAGYLPAHVQSFTRSFANRKTFFSLFFCLVPQGSETRLSTEERQV